MKSLDIIRKIREDELSFQECLEFLKDERCWKLSKKNGTLAIFIFKKLITYLPDGEETTETFETLLKGIDIKVSKMLKELDDEMDNNNNDELFRLFSRSPTYRHLYNSVNWLFRKKKENLNRIIGVTKKEYEQLKKKIKIKAIDEIKISYACVYDKKIEKDILIKKFKEVKHLLNEKLAKQKKKLEDKKMNEHVIDIIYHAKLARLFYCSIFRNPFGNDGYGIPRISLQRIVPIHFEEHMKKNVRLDYLFKKCERVDNFFLNLQTFLVRNLVEKVSSYVKRYKEKKNFLNEIVYEIDKRYPHLLWPIIEKRNPELYDKIMDIHSKDFKKFLLEKKYKIKDLFLKRKETLSSKYEDLILLFYIKTWFEDIKEIKHWSDFYLQLDILDENNLNFKRLNGEFYPIIVKLFYTCWGVLYEDTVYFGDLICTLFKYREIIEEKFNFKMQKILGSMKKESIKNFLIFSIF